MAAIHRDYRIAIDDDLDVQQFEEAAIRVANLTEEEFRTLHAALHFHVNVALRRTPASSTDAALLALFDSFAQSSDSAGTTGSAEKLGMHHGDV